MDEAPQSIHQRLKATARRHETTFYSEIAPLAGLNMESEYDRIRLAQILDEISRGEHSQGRPLLSAVVIRKDENLPGQGFFNLARDLGLYAGNDDLEYWVKELARVHQHWSED